MTRQVQDCRRLADARGWEVVETYTDDDRSAFSGKTRPEYERMMRDVEAGRVTALIVWHPDRLHRAPKELESFIDTIEAHGTTVATCTAGDVDLATPDGRLLARIIGSVARKESEDKSRRLQRKHAEIAERGRWSGGTRPYGYQSVGDGALEVVAAEADVILEAARRVLAGESTYAIASDLNARGITTAKGATWRPGTLRRILTAPNTAGLREHRGEVVGAATWPPILDETTWRRLRALLRDPSRAGAMPARSYLLTGGLARCGRCGSPLRAQRRAGHGVYWCVPGPGKGGCGGVSTRSDPVDALVTEAVLTALDTPALSLVAEERPDETVPITEKLAELAEMWANGEVTRGEWLAARKPLEARLAQARRRQSVEARQSVLDPYTAHGGALRSAWPALSLDQRRAVLGAVLERVTVLPAAKMGPGFDPGRVRLEWRA